MTRHVLFFDDFPLEAENQIFLLKLRRAFKGTDVEVEEQKTVPSLAGRLETHPFDAMILDIMAAMPDTPGMEALAGIEILRRCRTGTYGPVNKDIPIYMRSARGELYVKQLAGDLKANGYFRPGSDDDELVATLKKLLPPL